MSDKDGDIVFYPMSKRPEADDMDGDIVFYPMSKRPEADDMDGDFSRTVLVFSENRRFVELGYYDFQEKQWSHFGEGSFLLKCWCYIPDPTTIINSTRWKAVKHSGYKESFFNGNGS